jgi:hypothetical protein
MGELMDESRMKEKDYQMALEDSRRIERKLDDQKRNLEIQLENTSAENEELKLRLSGAEGRVNALEATLARLEGSKRDIEFKLSSIVSSLRLNSKLFNGGFIINNRGELVPLAGEFGLDRLGLGVRDLTGLRALGISCLNPIVLLKLDTMLLSLNSMSRLLPSSLARVASRALTLP